MEYIEVIKIAVMFFPVIALFISIPFILIQYHKFGSVSFMKSLILYSFILYLMCAYFLVILPLPERVEVMALTTPRVQLIPFNFVIDFIKQSSFVLLDTSTYLGALKDKCLYVVIFNIFMTLPFGIYLRYYFKRSKKETILYTFLLSLFFELTQLTGLYFIYPRGYRLFDVDDLLLNTLGGFIGYLVAPLFIRFLPTKEEINDKAHEKGKKMSGFRRFTAICLDLFFYTILCSVVSLLIGNFNLSGLIGLIIYFIIIPYIKKGMTFGQKFLNLKIVDNSGKNNLWLLILRVILFILFYMFLPIVLIMIAILLNGLDIEQHARIFILVIYISLVTLFYIITVIKYMFTNRQLLYEKISHTKMISTIE